MNNILNNLQSKVNTLDCFSEKNNITKTIGKRPIIKGWNSCEKLEYKVLLDHINDSNLIDANLGWVLASTDLVIDIDLKNGGIESFEKLLKMANLNKEDLPYTVKTQGGGYHIYLKINNDSDNVRTISKNIKGFEGIDFLSIGDCCAMVNNTIGDKKYHWVDQSEPIDFVAKNAPKTLIDVINAQKEGSKDLKGNINNNINDMSKRPYISKKKVQDWLQNIEKSDGHDWWLKIGFALYDWDPKKGLDLWDEWSKTYKAYNPKQVTYKWESFGKDYAGKKITIRSLIKEASGVEDEETAAQYKIMLEKCSNYYYLQYKDKFFDISNHTVLSRGALEMSIKKYIPKKRGYRGACDFIEKTENSIIIVHHEGVFDDSELMIKHNGMNYLNMHFIKMHEINCNMPEISTDINRNDIDDCVYLETYLRVLFEGEDLCIFAAWIRMAREGLVGWAPLVQGVEGIGKSKLMFVLKACLGDANVQEITAGSVESEFTSWAGRSQLANFFDEAKSTEQGWKTLKLFITEKSVEVICKGVDGTNVKNVTSYFLATNYLDAIPFTKTERRLWAVVSRFRTKKQSMDFIRAQAGIPNDITSDQFYGRISNILEKKQHIVRSYIFNLKYDKYVDIRQAPINESFYKMYYASLGNPRGYLETKSIIESGGKYYYQDIVSQQDVFEHRNIGEASQIKTLKKLGLTKLDEDIIIDGLSKTFWINEETINPDEIEDIMTKHSVTMDDWDEKLVTDLEVAEKLLAKPTNFHHKGVLLGLQFFEKLDLRLSNPQKSKLLKDLNYVALGRVRFEFFKKKTQLYSNKGHNQEEAYEIIFDHINRCNSIK